MILGNYQLFNVKIYLKIYEKIYNAVLKQSIDGAVVLKRITFAQIQIVGQYKNILKIMTKLKDSGKRRKFKTGGVRDIAEGKGRMDLLPMGALILLSKHFEDGAKKYEDRNWEKGLPLNCFVDSGLRHIAKVMNGEDDEPHLRAAVWNFICLLETAIRIKNGKLPKELNNLPNFNLETMI